MSEDPSGFGGGDSNLYRYAGNSPTNGTDPSGLWAEDPWWNDSRWDWANPWAYGWFRWVPNLAGGYYSSIVQGAASETKQQVSQQEAAIGAISTDINADFNRFRKSQRLGENTTIMVTGAAAAVFAFEAGGGYRSFGSFGSFKRELGAAGDGMVWHHIVEQSQQSRFGAQAIHNTTNVLRVSAVTNTKLNALYSSIRYEITGSHSLTVRQWLKEQSYDANREFGLRALENVNQGVWP